jgi:hypothetical protein
MQVDSKSTLAISSCTFYSNIANMSMSIGLVSDSNKLTITKSLFKENIAITEGYCLSIMQTPIVNIDSCKFESNFAKKGSSNLEASYFTKINITKTSFKISLDESKLFMTQGKGHFIIGRSETDVQIRESTFTGG